MKNIPCLMALIVLCAYACRPTKIAKDERPIHQCKGVVEVKQKTTKKIWYVYEPSLIRAETSNTKTDTIALKQLTCLFREEIRPFVACFDQVDPAALCVGGFLAGKSYFSVQVDTAGNMNDFQVERSLHDCLTPYYEEIQERIKELRLLNEMVFDSQLVFSLRISYHKKE